MALDQEGAPDQFVDVTDGEKPLPLSTRKGLDERLMCAAPPRRALAPVLAVADVLRVREPLLERFEEPSNGLIVREPRPGEAVSPRLRVERERRQPGEPGVPIAAGRAQHRQRHGQPQLRREPVVTGCEEDVHGAGLRRNDLAQAQRHVLDQHPFLELAHILSSLS